MVSQPDARWRVLIVDDVVGQGRGPARKRSDRLPFPADWRGPRSPPADHPHAGRAAGPERR
jgi:hypothetical protein